MLTLDITDNKLMEIFKSPKDQELILLSFISDKTKKLLNNSFENIDHQEIWKQLLIEAIHFLRINDFRERAFFRRTDISKLNKRNKTTISTSGAYEDSSLNSYGIVELYKYFQRFTNFESILYGTDINYRDHIEHPLRVWLIGLNILNDYGDKFQLHANKDIQIEKCKFAIPKWNLFEPEKYTNKKYELKISLAELTAMWTIIALTHDLGYPLERFDQVNEQLGKMFKEFGKIDFSPSSFTFQAQHDHLVLFLLQIISSTVVSKEKLTNSHKDKLYTHISSKYFAKFSRSWELFEHGIVSSLILLRSLNYFLETDFTKDQFGYLKIEDSRQFSVRSEILHAIAAHTTKKIYQLSANTLSFLLVLCDELQVLKRPTMLDMHKSERISRDGEVQLKFEISKIKEKTQSNIICDIKYKKKEYYESQNYYIRKIFKGWHERLRPAVDDAKRNMNFNWRIKFGNLPHWEFGLDTTKKVFKQFTTKGPDKEFKKIINYKLYD